MEPEKSMIVQPNSKFKSFSGYEDLEESEKEEVSQRKRDIASGHSVSLEDL